jgi:hypothetical protein
MNRVGKMTKKDMLLMKQIRDHDTDFSRYLYSLIMAAMRFGVEDKKDNEDRDDTV